MGRPRKSPSMTDGKREIISRLIEEYDIKTAEDIQEALRDLLGGTIQGMMECEMEAQKEEHQHPIPNTMTQETVTNQRLYAPTTDL